MEDELILEEPQLAQEEPATGCHQEPTLIWTPETIASLDRDDLDLYLQFAASPCIQGGGCNVEEALDVLHQARGDLKDAMQRLLKMTTNTQEIWTLEEVQAFERLQMSHGKNFYLISQDLKTKTVKECVQFYYIWKKSTFRNRYISPTTPKSVGSVTSVTSSSSSASSASSSSTITTTATTPTSTTAIPINLSASQPNLSATPSSSTSDESRDSGRGESLLSIDEHKQYQLLALQNIEQEFPCKVCGQVFLKIKSRSAHMKRHKNEGYRR